MKKLLILAITLFVSIINFSQVDTAWTKRYNGPGNFKDKAIAIAVDGSGNVFITGESYGSGTIVDYATIKYSSNGIQEWLNRYHYSTDDIARSLTVNSAGYAYVTGSSVGASGSNWDYATIKYSPDGDTLWTKRFSGIESSEDHAYAVVTDQAGNVYVTGTVDRNPVDSIAGNVFFTIKYDSNGDTLWARKYRDLNTIFDVAYAMTLDNAGNVYVTGESKGQMDPSYDFDYLTIKYSSAGDTLWVAKYAGPGGRQDIPTDIEVDQSGNVYVTGKSRPDSISFENYDYLTIKYNSSGATEWIARYDGPNNDLDEAHGLVLDDFGNVYVTGLSYGAGTGADIATIKFNSSGDTVWVRRFNGTGNGPDGANAISIDNTGNIYVAGFEYNSTTYNDYVILKYDSNGDIKWLKRFPGNGGHDDEITAMVLDDEVNIYVTGNNYGVGTNDDFLTIKYVQTPSDIEQGTSSDMFPLSFKLDQNYPNPFNPSTKIAWQLPETGLVTLKIFDVLGREISTLVNEELTAGKHEVVFDATHYKSGIYFYQLLVSALQSKDGKAGSFTQTKKMILIK